MRKAAWIGLAGLALALSGCQDSGLDLAARSGKPVTVGAQTPVALDSMEGLPDAVSPRFSAALAREAQARELVFVDAAGGPRFRLRGYLNAYPSDGGTTLSWVWDVFDASLKRARRVAGTELLRRSDANPWNAVDDAALSRAAARSLDEVGGFLIERPRPEVPVAAAPATAARATGD